MKRWKRLRNACVKVNSDAAYMKMERVHILSSANRVAHQLANEGIKQKTNIFLMNDEPEFAEGCASVKFHGMFQEYNMEFKPDIMSLLETRVSGVKVDKIIDKLGFQYSHWVKLMVFLE
ncbi:hypothetical protein Goklo_025469, partial [Gossypium klotzschianum]|nr:hypothetical protein [Gossypium klotzschianum]